MVSFHPGSFVTLLIIDVLVISGHHAWYLFSRVILTLLIIDVLDRSHYVAITISKNH
jgi:hypothetical protein